MTGRFGPDPERAKGLILPLAAAFLSYVLWSTPIVYPLKIFVVFLHELSHGVAAVASGGQIERIELSAAEGGLCVTRGGSRFLILNAGYLGSLALGASFVVVGARSRHDRALVALVAFVTLAVTLLYVRSVFGFVYGLGAGATLLLVATRLPHTASDLALRAIGSVSCLYAVWDTITDALLRRARGSDAAALAELTGLPAALWGLLWALLSLGVWVWALWLAAGARVGRRC